MDSLCAPERSNAHSRDDLLCVFPTPVDAEGPTNPAKAIGFLSSMIFVTAVVVPLQLWTAYILGSWVFFIFLFMLLVCGQ